MLRIRDLSIAEPKALREEFQAGREKEGVLWGLTGVTSSDLLVNVPPRSVGKASDICQ
jgi:hypothetical protein